MGRLRTFSQEFPQVPPPQRRGSAVGYHHRKRFRDPKGKRPALPLAFLPLIDCRLGAMLHEGRICLSFPAAALERQRPRHPISRLCPLRGTLTASRGVSAVGRDSEGFRVRGGENLSWQHASWNSPSCADAPRCPQHQDYETETRTNRPLRRCRGQRRVFQIRLPRQRSWKPRQHLLTGSVRGSVTVDLPLCARTRRVPDPLSEFRDRVGPLSASLHHRRGQPPGDCWNG